MSFGNGLDAVDFHCLVNVKRLSFLAEDTFTDELNNALALPENEDLAEKIKTGEVELTPNEPWFIADLAQIARSSHFDSSDLTLNEHLASLLPLFAFYSEQDYRPALVDVFAGDDFEVYRLSGQVIVIVHYEYKEDEVFEISDTPVDILDKIEERIDDLEVLWGGK